MLFFSFKAFIAKGRSVSLNDKRSRISRLTLCSPLNQRDDCGIARRLEQARLCARLSVFWRVEAQVLVGTAGGDAATAGAVEESEAEEEWLDDLLDGVLRLRDQAVVERAVALYE